MRDKVWIVWMEWDRMPSSILRLCKSEESAESAARKEGIARGMTLRSEPRGLGGRLIAESDTREISIHLFEVLP